MNVRSEFNTLMTQANRLNEAIVKAENYVNGDLLRRITVDENAANEREDRLRVAGRHIAEQDAKIGSYEARLDNQARSIAGLQEQLERAHTAQADVGKAFTDLLSVMTLPEMASLVLRVAEKHNAEEVIAAVEDNAEMLVLEFNL